MAKADLALLTQTGMVMDREKLQSVLPEVIQAAPQDAVMLRFTIMPLAVTDEVSAVMDRMSHVAHIQQCDGIGTMEPEEDIVSR